jgi:chromosome segregation ATPase
VQIRRIVEQLEDYVEQLGLSRTRLQKLRENHQKALERAQEAERRYGIDPGERLRKGQWRTRSLNNQMSEVNGQYDRADSWAKGMEQTKRDISSMEMECDWLRGKISARTEAAKQDDC